MASPTEHSGGGRGALHTPRYDRLREVLVEARLKAGLTQVEVAAALERPQSFVSKFETGERRLDVIEFIDVAHALKVSPAALLEKIETV